MTPITLAEAEADELVRHAFCVCRELVADRDTPEATLLASIVLAILIMGSPRERRQVAIAEAGCRIRDMVAALEDGEVTLQ
jgi:hypothetical protein